MSYPTQSALLHPNRLWHLRQRAAADRIFYQPEDYRDFLLRLHERSAGLFQVYGFALLPNHYHLLLKTAPREALLETWAASGQPVSRSILRTLPIVPPSLDQPGVDYLRTLPDYVADMACAKYISRQLGTVLASFALHVNGRERREGELFHRPFLRREVPPEHALALLVHLHRNVRHHRLGTDFTTYPHSSYRAYLSERSTALPRAEVLDWYGGREGFVQTHTRAPDRRGTWRKYALE